MPLKPLKKPYDPDADEDDDGVSRENTPEEGEADDFDGDFEDMDDADGGGDDDMDGGDMDDGADLFDDLEENDDPDEPEDLTQTIQEVSEGLARLGIMVEPTMDAGEFLRHVCTAISTHHATKDGPDSMNGQIDTNNPQGAPTMAGATEEPQVVQLSLQQRLERTEKALAAERGKALEAKIDGLVQSGRVTPARAQKWRESLQARRLSLVTEDGSLTGTLAQIEAAEETPEGTFWDEAQKASHRGTLKDETAGWGEEDSSSLDPHVMSKLTGGRWKPEPKKEAS